MQPSPDYSDIFELNSVFTDFWNSHIDTTITSAYVAKENEPDFTENLDKYFAKALTNLRGEISHTQASIGSTTVSDSPCELFQRDLQVNIHHHHHLAIICESGHIFDRSIGYVPLNASHCQHLNRLRHQFQCYHCSIVYCYHQE